MEHLAYPIGRFDKTREYTFEEASAALDYIEAFPALLRSETERLTAAELEKVYRPGGWNIRQVVHHLADSHMNFYVRVKLSLTEDNPQVKGYREDLWAESADYSMSIENPLQLLASLHARLVCLFRNLNRESYRRTFYHTGYKTTYVLQNALHLCRWHSAHHLEHIRLAIRTDHE